MPSLLTRRIESLLWHARIAHLPAAAQRGIGVVRFVYAVLRDIAIGPLTLRAMGLVYVTILSLVPLLAVGFSVLKAFGFHRQLEPLLFQFFGPLGQRGSELTERIIGFVDNAQGDVLAGVGLLFLFFTAVSMAEQVEGSLNQIWRVDRPRSLGRRVSEYLSVILVGPVVMVTAMTLIATLRSAELVRDLPGVSGAGMFSELFPYLLVCLGFSFVYWFVPNTNVRPVAAFAGGLVGGVLWAGTGALFAAFVVTATMTISIYATFAIVITALFWLYLCWLILLVGAQVAFYTQNPDYLRTGYRVPVTGTGQQEQAALAVMLIVGKAFRDGGGAAGLNSIAQATGLPGLSLTPVVSRLSEAGLLTRTADDRLLPQRDPARITLAEIVNAIRHPARHDVGPRVRWSEALLALNRRLESGIGEALRDETLGQALDREQPDGGSPASGER